MAERILVVDDDTKVLDILQKNLTKRGYQVHLATGGEEALDLYRKSEPDLVVIDVMLPDMDGRDVFKIIRSASRSRVIPVMFLSASADPNIRVSTFDHGADDFIVKPFSLHEFNAKIRKVLEAYRITRELQKTRRALEQEVSETQQNYVQVNKELKRQLLAMKTLVTVSQDLNERLDLGELINGFALTIMGELQISNMAVFARLRDKEEEFELYGLKGFDRRRVGDLSVPADSDFTRSLVGQSEPRRLREGDNLEWAARLPDTRLAAFEYVTPIIVKKKLKGIVFTGPKLTGGSYTRYDLDMLKSICNSAGIGLENARLFTELQSTYLSTVKALVSIIEAKDPYTKGHTERVAEYAIALGRKLSLSSEELRDVAFAAVLHDIGKLVLYEKVLNKPGSLNEEEWEMVKQHPVIGAEIIENMEFLAGTVAMVRHHHEHWDGKGYPDGLKGEEIPIGARIISVADSFDAMTTDRSYRKALTRREALKILKSQSGTQFDANVVEKFVELIEDDNLRPRTSQPVLTPETL